MLSSCVAFDITFTEVLSVRDLKKKKNALFRFLYGANFFAGQSRYIERFFIVYYIICFLFFRESR